MSKPHPIPADQMRRLTARAGKVIVPFGSNKGQPLGDVSPAWRAWALSNLYRIDKGLRAAIALSLGRDPRTLPPLPPEKAPPRPNTGNDKRQGPSRRYVPDPVDCHDFDL